MIAGLILKDSNDEESHLALLGDNLECMCLNTNEDIVQELKERNVEIVAVNAPLEVGRKQFNQGERDLKEEGHVFTPSSSMKTEARRLEALRDRAFNVMGSDSPDFIRFDPNITAKELALDSDNAMDSLGVDASGLEGAEEFDAALGAVTARFYQQNQFEEMGVVVPEPLKTSEEQA